MENRQYALKRDYVKLGKFLRKARDKAGLTQREVSLELGYSSSQFISNFECGIAMPPLKRLKRLADLYGVSAPELIEVTIDSERGILKKTLMGKRGI